MKNRTATLTILFASALMLVLSVLPHHHHGKIIHFGVVERCETCQDDETDDLTDLLKRASHRHSHSEDPDCDLRHLFVISARDEHLSLGYLNYAGQDRSTIDPATLLLLFETCAPFSLTANPGQKLTFPVMSESLRSLIAGNICALRAPPVFIA